MIFSRVIRSFLEWVLRKKLQTHYFHPAFPLFLFKTKERIALHRSSSLFSLFVKEIIALVAILKRATRAIRFFKRANHSFALKKQAIHTKNPRANTSFSKSFFIEISIFLTHAIHVLCTSKLGSKVASKWLSLSRAVDGQLVILT